MEWMLEEMGDFWCSETGLTAPDTQLNPSFVCLLQQICIFCLLWSCGFLLLSQSYCMEMPFGPPCPPQTSGTHAIFQYLSCNLQWHSASLSNTVSDSAFTTLSKSTLYGWQRPCLDPLQSLTPSPLVLLRGKYSLSTLSIRLNCILVLVYPVYTPQ